MEKSDPPPAYYGYARPEVVALVPPSATKILDIGCAAGALGAGLKARAPCEVWGIEMQPSAAAAARDRLDHVIEGDALSAEAELADQAFDAVIMADVLEHVADTEGMLALARRILVPDGKLILSLPNVRHWSVLQMLLGGEWRYFDSGIMDRTHLKFFTMRSAVRTLKDSGFMVEHAAGTNVTSPPPEGFIEGLQKVMAENSMDAGNLATEAALYQLLFVCGKMPET
jgi:O-antigen biosynthesis protein